MIPRPAFLKSIPVRYWEEQAEDGLVFGARWLGVGYRMRVKKSRIPGNIMCGLRLSRNIRNGLYNPTLITKPVKRWRDAVCRVETI